MNTKINLGVQCYPGNNKNKMKLLLASLLIKYNYHIFDQAVKDYNTIYLSKLLKMVNENKIQLKMTELVGLRYLYNKVIYFPDIELTSPFEGYIAKRTNNEIEFRIGNKNLIIEVDELKPGLLKEFIEIQILAYHNFYEMRVDEDKHLANYVYQIVAVKTMYFILEIKNREFNSIEEIIDLACKDYNFIKINTNNIKVSIIVDNISGQKYESFTDFYNRLEQKDLEQIDSCMNYKYFMYKKGDVKSIGKTKFIDYTKEKIRLLTDDIATKAIETLKKNNPNIVFPDLDKYELLMRYNIIFSKELKQAHDLIQESPFKALNILFMIRKLDYRDFIQDYDELPDLKSLANEYFNNKFVNFDSGINELNNIYEEFHVLYPNSDIMGTKYHTNAMISRNIFLSKNFRDYNFIIDDDDFSSSLDDRNDFIQYYKQMTNDIFNKGLNMKLKQMIRKVDHAHKCLNITDLEEFRKSIFTFFKQPMTQTKTEIYKTYMKLCVYRFRGIIKTTRNNEIEQKSVHCSGVWSAVFPPYCPNCYMNVQEMASDDVGFMEAHEALHNHAIDTFIPIYYYIDSGYTGYDKIDFMDPEFKNRIHVLRAITINEKNNREPYVNNMINFGKYYYKYDSIVPYINNDKTESLEFVSNHLRRNKNPTKDYNTWNSSLNKEPVLTLHY